MSRQPGRGGRPSVGRRGRSGRSPRAQALRRRARRLWRTGAGAAAVAVDIYYLLDSSGHIAYINAAPASAMSQLLAHAGGRT